MLNSKIELTESILDFIIMNFFAPFILSTKTQSAGIPRYSLKTLNPFIPLRLTLGKIAEYSGIYKDFLLRKFRKLKIWQKVS